MKILLTFATTLILLALVASFNFYVDPMCYYHCNTVDILRPTMNTFYNITQKVAAFPESELIMVGSSRGQTTPPLWIQDQTHLKTLNMSVGGAEVIAKLAFLNLALDKLPVKKIIWFADYYELIPEDADPKIKNTPVLQPYVMGKFKGLGFFNKLQTLIDHNTLEAAIYKLKRKPGTEIDQGSGSYLDYKLCDSNNYKGERPLEEMKKGSGMDFDLYVKKVLLAPQSDDLFNILKERLRSISQKNIDIAYVILPYNPIFRKRLLKEYPHFYDLHIQWIEKLNALKGPHIKVYDFFNGIPNDDGSERFWNDGVHFNCKGSMEILKKVL